jgi:hypothetical protein
MVPAIAWPAAREVVAELGLLGQGDGDPRDDPADAAMCPA